MDSYLTLAGAATTEFTEKRSRFLGSAAPARSEEEALAFLEGLRARYWDAKHNVYAYALREGQLSRFSDDGEPQGTAGMPVLEVLRKSQAVDCIVVVTRYFGGVLLGAGGLVRAYTHAAKLAVEAAGIVTMRRAAECALVCGYAQHGRVAAALASCGGVTENTRFSDQVEIDFLLQADQVGRCSAALRDATGGAVDFRVRGERFAPFEE